MRGGGQIQHYKSRVIRRRAFLATLPLIVAIGGGTACGIDINTVDWHFADHAEATRTARSLDAVWLPEVLGPSATDIRLRCNTDNGETFMRYFYATEFASQALERVHGVDLPREVGRHCARRAIETGWWPVSPGRTMEYFRGERHERLGNGWAYVSPFVIAVDRERSEAFYVQSQRQWN
jgi:hypothetical protein